jgi:hypothetical protein
MIEAGMLIKSKIDQPYPSLIAKGSEGRAMMKVRDDVWICVFDGHQVHMNEDDLETAE